MGNENQAEQKEYRKSFRRAAKDADIKQMCEEGLSDYIRQLDKLEE